ncbi:MAG: hypothetical protein EP332_03485 [Bacteroidetes bacterium]|nr:MAG: hypothetical protein EP332_03485 [Bacteroidota bacterium]
MHYIGQIDDRSIYYLSVKSDSNWAVQLPDKDWIVVPICDKRDAKLMEQVAQACLEHKVLYVCALGTECSWVDDYFDETVLANRIKQNLPLSSSDDFDGEPMTTWHHNLDEGFWFAATSAYPTLNDEYLPVNKVVCLDLTENSHQQQLTDLAVKINSGWLPPDVE